MPKGKYYGEKPQKGSGYKGAKSYEMGGGMPSDIFPKDVKFMGAKSPCDGLSGPAADDMGAIDKRAKEMDSRLKKQKLDPYL